MKTQQQNIRNAAKRVAVNWGVFVVLGIAITEASSVGRIGIEHLLLRGSCVLAMLICMELLRIETKKGKPVTLSLAFVFGCTGIMVFLAETEVVTVLSEEPFASFYVNQYSNAIYNVSLLFFGLFLLINTVATLSTLKKYLIASTAAMLLGIAFYYPIIDNPRYAYAVPEVLDFRTIDQAQKDLTKAGTVNPDPELISKNIALPRWEGKTKVGVLAQTESVRRIKKILPYTKGKNYVNLVDAPSRLIGIHINLLTLCLVAFLILASLIRDPLSGAYIDKLGIVFFVYLVFEIIHGYVLREIIEWDVFLKIDGIGKLVTTLLVLLMAFVEFRRYVFLSQGFGRYYEAALIRNPSSVTRWRDGFDNLILGQFFNPRLIIGRFFQARERSAISRKKSEKTLDNKP